MSGDDQQPTLPGNRGGTTRRSDAAPASDGPDATMPGTRVRRGQRPTSDRAPVSAFTMREELGRGGMGRVWVADDPELRREVAVKVLHTPDSLRAVQRFLEEAQITGQLEHPNIVPVHQLGRDDKGRPWLAMKRVRGRTLREYIGKAPRHPAPITPEEVADILDVFGKICDAVAFAHNRGVIHRDLKPDNVMVGEFGEVLVMDWGLARTVGDSVLDLDVEAGGGPDSVPLTRHHRESRGKRGRRPVSTARNRLSGDVDETLPDPPRVVTDRATNAAELTADGEVFGTPAYMAPEQATGSVAGKRTDIFALGAILYHLLTKHPPYEGKDTLSVVVRASKRDLADPRHRVPARRISRELAAITMKALAADPDDRYPTVEAFKADLQAWRTNRAVSASPPGIVARTVKWARRHPAAAMSGGVGVLAVAVIAVIVASVMAFASRQQLIAEEQAREAAEQARIAAEQRERAETEARQAAEAAAEAQRLEDEKFRAEMRAHVQQGQINELRRVLGLKVERERNAARDKWSTMCADVVGLGTDIERLIEPLNPDEVEEILAAYEELFAAHEEHGVAEITARDYYERAILYSALLQYEKAMADTEQALQLDPQFWPALILRGICRVNMGAPLPPGVMPEKAEVRIPYDDVLADVDRAILLRPETASERASVWAARGIVNSYAERYDDAHDDFRQAREEDPSLPLLWSSWAALYEREKNFEQAAACHDRAVQLGRGTASPYIARGIYRYNRGYPQPRDREMLRAAVEDFDQALEYHPDSTQALAYRGCAKFYLGDRRGCFADLNHAIELRPNHYLPYFFRCGVYIQMLNIPAAIADFDKGYELTPPSIQPALEPLKKLVDTLKGN